MTLNHTIRERHVAISQCSIELNKHITVTGIHLIKQEQSTVLISTAESCLLIITVGIHITD